ncbi:MAG: hypothetical protein ACI9MC_003752 [Kiritimatiellia bacterium]|jgi:uncharacterized protein with von Willebrand factor type A (vWA) domain
METTRGLQLLERFLPGVGWSSAPGHLRRVMLKQLDRTVELLGRMPQLEAIAEALGRVEEARRRAGENMGGSEEVAGVHFGGDVAHALPSELGLLGDVATEDLFYARWAERRLVSLELVGEGMGGSAEGAERGPIIACVDTSASMQGAPELAAKALILAICRRVLPQGRIVHLLLFGSRDQGLELRLQAGRGGLEPLLDFLASSFDGGTDFDTPLLRALDLLEEQELRDADVLVITDGQAAASMDVVARVEEVRRAVDLKVWSVVLGGRWLDGVSSFSDQVWTLSTDRPGVGAVDLVRRFERTQEGWSRRG